MNLIGKLNQFRYLNTTVRSIYGTGATAWLNFIYYGLFRINKFKILHADLEDILEEKPELPFVSISYPTISELDSLRTNRNLPREFFCDQFQRVSKCCVAKVDGELAYIHWVYFAGDFSRFLRVDKYSAEINYVITLPDYRGRGICTGAIMHTMLHLKKQDIKYLFAVIHEENVASIKSFSRAGFAEIGSIRSLGPFNRNLNVQHILR